MIPYNSLSNQIKHLYNSDTIPQKITFSLGEDRKTINVISNLSVEPAGAFMAARDIIADEINEHIKNLWPRIDWEGQHFNPFIKSLLPGACPLLFLQGNQQKI